MGFACGRLMTGCPETCWFLASKARVRTPEAQQRCNSLGLNQRLSLVA